jgi:hypothetical protein
MLNAAANATLSIIASTDAAKHTALPLQLQLLSDTATIVRSSMIDSVACSCLLSKFK